MASSSAIVISKPLHSSIRLSGYLWLFLAMTLVSLHQASATDTSHRDGQSVFDFQSVCKVAEQRLPIPFSRKVRDLPCELVGLDYDSWRYIAYEAPETVWRAEDLPFQFETGHRGYLFTQRVELNEVTAGRSENYPFNPHAFQYRNWLMGYRFPRTLGHSGWKLLCKFNDERRAADESGQKVDIREIGSFLGASYFRILGSKHLYGSSTRGLAVDCAMPHPEEFPVFTEYWLERPNADATTFRFWALLESERVIGAYQFDITPDVESTVDVKAKLYIRGKIDKLGIAPITSMWMWGGGTKPPADDPRPEVHDADGLYVLDSNNNPLWRPLSRPSAPIVNHYAVPGLKAFGLVQRARDAKDYADSEALYHRRPSILIEPKEAWPAGGVELLRLPASHEGIDNIGAFYLLQNPPQEGESIEVEYRIHICDDDKQIASQHPTNKSEPEAAVATVARFIRSDVSQSELGLWRINLVAEVKGTALEGMEAKDLSEDMVSLWNQSGNVVQKKVSSVPEGIQVAIEIEAEQNEAMELLVHLHDTKRVLTERWSYRCEP